MAKTGRRTGGEGWKLLRSCSACGRDEARCRCPAGDPSGPERATARLRLETRRGKPVTVVAITGAAADTLRGMVKHLRSTCSTGGATRAGSFELQGDHREKTRAYLVAQGWRVKP